MFRKMPFILLALIIAIVVLDPMIPLACKSFFYAASLTIKSFIVFCLPFVIFSLLFKTMSQLARKATALIGLVLLTIVCSNFLSTWISHYIGSFIYNFYDLSLAMPQNLSKLEALWHFEFPSLIANDKAMFAGLVLGILISSWKPNLALKIGQKLEIFVAKILQVFMYLIPCFVSGFVMKLQHDGVIMTIVKDYALIFFTIMLAQLTYISFLYLLANRFKFKGFWFSLRNMLPAAMTGFSTMSSAAAMPLTILGTEKNTGKSDWGPSLIPLTVNVHLIGDCFAIPIFAYAILKNYGLAEPTLVSYLTFAGYFVLAKFSVAAIPGGGIIVMLPILEKYLGFHSEMLSLITALYILFDPVITCANVLGNGSFAMLMDKVKNFRTAN